jgi:hypothetical protein
MCRVLVDYAGASKYQQRGDAVHVSFDEALVVSRDPRPDTSCPRALETLATFAEKRPHHLWLTRLAATDSPRHRRAPPPSDTRPLSTIIVLSQKATRQQLIGLKPELLLVLLH